MVFDTEAWKKKLKEIDRLLFSREKEMRPNFQLGITFTKMLDSDFFYFFPTLGKQKNN